MNDCNHTIGCHDKGILIWLATSQIKSSVTCFAFLRQFIQHWSLGNRQKYTRKSYFHFSAYAVTLDRVNMLQNMVFWLKSKHPSGRQDCNCLQKESGFQMEHSVCTTPWRYSTAIGYRFTIYSSSQSFCFIYFASLYTEHTCMFSEECSSSSNYSLK